MAVLILAANRCCAQTTPTPTLDAETHPYGTVTVTGVTGALASPPGGDTVTPAVVPANSLAITYSLKNLAKAVQFYKFVLSEREHAAKGKQLSEPERVRREALIREFAPQFSQVQPSAGGGQVTGVEPPTDFRAAISQLSGTSNPLPFDTAQQLFTYAKTQLDGVQRQYDQVRNAYVRNSAFFVLQQGAVSAQRSVTIYESGFFALPESAISAQSIDTRFEAAVFGTSINSLDSRPGGKDSYTSSLGGIVAFGNPSSVFGTVELGTYFSPDITDAEAVVSGLLFSGRSSRLENAPGDTDSADFPNGERHLFDHVRRGDIWVDAGYRILGNEVIGQAGEGGITWALPFNFGSHQYPNLVPTLSLTGTYCAKHELGLDEGAVELRLPLAHPFGDRPLFIIGRYGTRDDLTLSLQIRL